MNKIIFAQSIEMLHSGRMCETSSPDTIRRGGRDLDLPQWVECRPVFYHRPERPDERQQPRHHPRAIISANSAIPS
jgi:hypothetical protein